MGKTRDIFKKIRDTKGNFHANMCTIKCRNGMDLTEAEDIKKRWQEYWSGLPFPSPRRREENKRRLHFKMTILCLHSAHETPTYQTFSPFEFAEQP